MNESTRRCTIEGCENTRKSRGWCAKHYARWSKHGDPLIAFAPKDPVDAKSCAIDGCNNAHVARGWCNMHYKRWSAYGNPEFTHMPDRLMGTPEERFWPKVDAEGDCWVWTKYRDKDGYGTFTAAGPGKSTRVHKFAWQTLVGEVPDGYELDHLCRNRPCCNPDHLEVVTHAENMRRTDATAQKLKYKASQRTHCKRNHPYSGRNLVMDGGQRRCRTCRNDAQRERKRGRMTENKDA
jgi:hypothetical protein